MADTELREGTLHIDDFIVHYSVERFAEASDKGLCDARILKVKLQDKDGTVLADYDGNWNVNPESKALLFTLTAILLHLG